MNIEIWKQIPGYEGIYEVSSWGHVRRISGGRGAVPGRILKPRAGSRGGQYSMVSLYDNLKPTGFLIHRLVLLAFVGVCPENHEINHMDGNKTNNCLENLEYVTPYENIHHAIDHGMINNNGENNPCSKLSLSQIKKIRSKYIKGKYGYKRLAKEFNVSGSAIYNIIKNNRWASAL